MCIIRSHISPRPCLHQLGCDVARARRPQPRQAPPGGTPPRPAPRRPRRACLDVLAQLLEVVEAGVHGEAVVLSGKLLELDLLDGDVEGRVATGEVAVPVLVREAQGQRALIARGRTEQAVLEALDQVPAAELDELVAALAALRMASSAPLPRGRRGSGREPT